MTEELMMNTAQPRFEDPEAELDALMHEIREVIREREAGSPGSTPPETGEGQDFAGLPIEAPTASGPLAGAEQAEFNQLVLAALKAITRQLEHLWSHAGDHRPISNGNESAPRQTPAFADAVIGNGHASNGHRPQVLLEERH